MKVYVGSGSALNSDPNTEKIIYIAECVALNSLGEQIDGFEIKVSWDRQEVLDAAEDDYNHMLPRYRSKHEWILWGRYYDGQETDAEAAWAEMLDAAAWLSDDTIAECETLFEG